MKQNLGGTDRVVRIAIAVVLVVGAGLVGFGSIAGIIMLVLAVVMLATSALAFCPLYLPFGLNTKPKQPSA
jgi:hypothetical protein